MKPLFPKTIGSVVLLVVGVTAIAADKRFGPRPPMGEVQFEPATNKTELKQTPSKSSNPCPTNFTCAKTAALNIVLPSCAIPILERSRQMNALRNVLQSIAAHRAKYFVILKSQGFSQAFIDGAMKVGRTNASIAAKHNEIVAEDYGNIIDICEESVDTDLNSFVKASLT